MIVFFEDLLGIASGVLLFSVLLLMLRGPARRFFIVFIYVAWEFLATSVLTVADWLYKGSASSAAVAASEAQRFYNRLYWTNDVLVDLLRFLVVIVLTYQATAEGPRRGAVRRLFAGVVIAVILLPFLIFHPTFTPWPSGQWFSSTSELLNFGAAIMNLVLWATLIASKQRDPQLLTVSAGLGVVVTGAAISYGLRHFIPPGDFRSVPDLFLMLTQIGGWTIWCWAFWPVARPHQASRNPVTSL